MREPGRAEIAVVGAGPVGLAASLLLADQGYIVALVAPGTAPSDRRTSALLAGSVSLLERIGVWRDLRDEAAPLRTLRIVDGTRRLLRAPEVTFDAREIDLDAFGYNVPNAALIAALDDAVANSAVGRIDAFVDGVAASIGEVHLRLSTGNHIVARLVVAADGRRSTVRDSVGIGVKTWRYNQSALVCNLRHELAHHDTSTEFHTEGGPFTLVPLAGRRSSVVWVDRPVEIERRLELDELALATEIEERSASILGAIAVDGPRQAFPLAGMTARHLAAERAILVGEAAHVFPPIGAQGLNLGYRDVADLGQILARPGADPGSEECLAAYDRIRRADVLVRGRIVEALNQTLVSDFLPIQAARGLGLFVLDRIPALRRFAMRQGIGAGRALAGRSAVVSGTGQVARGR